MLIRWLWELFTENNTPEEYEGLPKGCWYCELLGMCRRPKEQGWKCYRGCLLLNSDNQSKPKRKKGGDFQGGNTP